MKTISSNLLLVGTILILIVAVTHLVIAFVGGKLYLFFGAGPEFYALDEQGSLKPMLSTLLLSMAFFVMALYGIGSIKAWNWLPWRKVILYAIAIVFILRGLIFFYEAFQVITNFNPVTLRFMFFSLYALITGMLYLLGVYLGSEATSTLT